MPSTKTTLSPSVVRIRANDDAQVVLHHADGDAFVLGADDVVSLCHLANIGREETQHQWQLVINHVRDWLKLNDKFVKELYLAPKGGRHLLLAILKEPTFNQELEDNLSDLDLTIARDSRIRLFKIDAIAVPDCGEETITAFLPCEN
jgi:hypothetical protein